MPQLLHIDSSADLHTSTSRELTALFAQTWAEISPEHEVVGLDLHRDPLPHLSDAALHYAQRLRVAGEQPDADAEALQGRVIEQLAAADVVVIGAPMYNWSIPSTLKAWIDYVHVLGTTVPFDTPPAGTSAQPMAGKPVVIVSSRGNTYAPGSGNEGDDHTVPPLVQVLGVSMGMNVSVITAELTLAQRIPPMAPLIEQGKVSLSAARDSLIDLARTLGT
ncbi:FMN-dependent NADH-azoreductase [Rhodococcus globerulus]|uniref:FMN-dependent NADH-azoreductase n=1 Tax=Rhodococcus globerulus TaxID=33008 RepID=UPI001F45305D|nr:NAD(P)H-dependent oxidoreductase [Rhodococcus globerulus]MCE4268474.1 NAD(P)H-dependent oxidoreductase [Rhodococcus globerulus]